VPVVNVDGQLYFPKISGFQRVIGPLVGIDEIELGFSVLQ
jgi:hypothetical protein